MNIETLQYIPEYKSLDAAGMDLHAFIPEGEITIKPKETVKIRTGLKVEIPKGYFGAIYPRSSVGTKKHLMLANTVGVIDSDYRGELATFFYNYGEEEILIKNGDRLSQLIIQPYEQVTIKCVDELSETERGEGGFGSTDV